MTAARPERRAALELRALLGKLAELRDEGDRARYDCDERYAWLVQRLWIAVGNEAVMLEPYFPRELIWPGLRAIRNELAHARLSDIDHDNIWRLTALSPSRAFSNA